MSETATEPVLNSPFLHQPDIRLMTTYPDDQGLAIVRRERPRLIIENLACPDHGGLDFCRELRAHRRTRSIPLIVVASPDQRPQTHSAAPDALLDKPVARREFYEAVRRFIELPRRRGQRVSLNLRFTFVENGNVQQAFSRDLSATGAFIKTDRPPPVGSRIELRFALPGVRTDLQCEGFVRGISDADGQAAQVGGFGVEFVGLPEEQALMLAEFVRGQCRPSFLGLH